jgi:hypothetical protein
VNLLTVPTEVLPLRYRSASMSSMANENIKTMDPAAKFMTPRPPPPPPAMKRLKTSPSPLLRKRNARSVSPKPPTLLWSPKLFFGLRSASPNVPEGDGRGRSSSSLGKEEPAVAIRPAVLTRTRSDDEKKVGTASHTRDASPHAFVRTRSREPSPLRHFVAQDTSSYNSAALVIPDEIEEDDAEDDDNFATQLNRLSFNDKGILTPLAPPPSATRFPLLGSLSGASTPRDISKPLPMLPEQVFVTLVPPPLRLRNPVSAAEMPRSHFSMSTISTTLTSPTESHFDFSGTPSIADSNDEEDMSADIGSGDESAYSPVKEVESRFTGYSLPDSDYTSEQSLQKEMPLSPLTQAASRTTFGGGAPFAPNAQDDVKNMSTLEELLSEMGYLGDVITGK